MNVKWFYAMCLFSATVHAADNPVPPFFTVKPASTVSETAFEGQVEAVKQTQLAAQVSGVVVRRFVKAGDKVVAGQLMFQIDSRAAQDTLAASSAQVNAAQANLASASAELERKKLLFAKNFVAKSVLEQAQSMYDSAKAQLNAVSAQARAIKTENSYFVVKAPYAGVIASVHIEQGDMAMPGKPLATLYDPVGMRVVASIPASGTEQLDLSKVRLELPTIARNQWQQPTHVQVLPLVDPQSMTRQVQADIAPAYQGAVPGMYARLKLPLVSSNGNVSYNIPTSALIKRGELQAVYVLDTKNQTLLRQIRVGQRYANEIEVLSGLDAGERVITDPRTISRK